MLLIESQSILLYIAVGSREKYFLLYLFVQSTFERKLKMKCYYVLTHSSEFLMCCRALAISAAIEPGGP